MDLLKFGDHVLGVCLGADATLTLRQRAPVGLVEEKKFKYFGPPCGGWMRVVEC